MSAIRPRKQRSRACTCNFYCLLRVPFPALERADWAACAEGAVPPAPARPGISGDPGRGRGCRGLGEPIPRPPAVSPRRRPGPEAGPKPPAGGKPSPGKGCAGNIKESSPALASSQTKLKGAAEGKAIHIALSPHGKKQEEREEREAREEGERALSEAADTVMRMRERPGRDSAGKGSGQEGLRETSLNAKDPLAL